MEFFKDLRFAVTLLLVVILGVALLFVRPMLVTGTAVDVKGNHVRTIVSGCLMCANKRLRVRADGFDTETLNLSPLEARDTGDRVTVSRWLLGLWQHVRVTMYEAQDVNAIVISSDLAFSDGKPTQVAATDPELGQRHSPETLAQRVRVETRGRRTVAGYVMLDDANRLTLVNETGGFILVEPMDGLPAYNRYRETLKRLRTAPEDGYRQSVVLDPERAHVSGQYFFYCRIGDRFGKGRAIAPWRGRSGDDVVHASNIEIWLNEDGGRALPRGR